MLPTQSRTALIFFVVLALAACHENPPQDTGGGTAAVPDASTGFQQTTGDATTGDVTTGEEDVGTTGHTADGDADTGGETTTTDTGTGEDATTGGMEDVGTTGGAAVAGDGIVINEIMYDPAKVSDDFGEYVELFNAGDKTVDLAGWTLRDKGSNSHEIDDSVVLEPGDYAVLARADNPANGGFEASYVYTDFYLAQSSGDSVVLENAAGDVVDSLSYQITAPWPVATFGVSIELKDPALDNEDGASWTHAVATYGQGDLGTPGRANGEVTPDFQVDKDVPVFQQPELKASLIFSPFDDVDQTVLALLASAQQSVRMSYFNIRLPSVMDALVDLKAQGVDVEVMLDAKTQLADFNTWGADALAAGLDVVLITNEKAEKAIMHNKFTVIDSEIVMTGSANLSTTALNKSDEDLLIVESVGLAQRYRAEYDEIVEGGNDKSMPYGADAAIVAWMGPEDDLDGKITALIEAAETSIHVAMFQVNQSGLVASLVTAHNAGKQVIVVIDAKFLAEGSLHETLTSAGVPVIMADNTLSMYSEMHSKLMIVDHKIAVMGSHNWTNLATFHNDENIVILNDAHLAGRCSGKFAELVKSYSEKTPEELGLVTTAQSVTLTVNNITLDPGATLYAQSVNDGGPWLEGIAFDGKSVTLELLPGTRLEYRYRVDGKGGAVFETGPKHFFTVPFAVGPFSVTDQIQL